MKRGKGFRISEAWLFTTIDEQDEEGLIGEYINGTCMPFVATDKKRYDDLMIRATGIAKATGLKISIKKMSSMEVTDSIG